MVDEVVVRMNCANEPSAGPAPGATCCEITGKRSMGTSQKRHGWRREKPESQPMRMADGQVWHPPGSLGPLRSSG
jgi:hypothetical protein